MIPHKEREKHMSLTSGLQAEGWAQVDRFVRKMPATRLSKVGEMRRRQGRCLSSELLERADRERGRSGNTAPSTLHKGGLDWLDLSLYGEGGERFRDVCQSADRAREAMKASKEAQRLHYVGRFFGLLYAKGTGHGYSHMPYHWKYKGISFRFGGCVSSGEELKRVLMFVDIPGECFLVLGEQQALSIVLEVVQSWGINVGRVAVRRVDGCIDMAGVSVDQFYNEVEAQNYITRSSGVNTFRGRGGEIETVSVRGEACSLTIYDKIKDTQKKHPQHFPYLEEHRWNGKRPECATRVEFRIRPGECGFADIRSLGDLLESIQRIFQWAGKVWFRLALVKDRRHTERANVHYLWLEVMASFAAWAEGCDVFLVRRNPAPVGVPQLAKSALGMLAKAVALAGLQVEGETLEKLFVDSLKDPSFDDSNQAIIAMRSALATRVYEHQAAGAY